MTNRSISGAAAVSDAIERGTWLGLADKGHDPLATVLDYKGQIIHVGDRIEIHPGTDLWMMGARYGIVVGIVPTKDDQVRMKVALGGKFS